MKRTAIVSMTMLDLVVSAAVAADPATPTLGEG